MPDREALTRGSYPGGLVQIVKHTGRINRVKPGEEPVIEIVLQPGQYVVSVKLEKVWLSSRSERVTDDYDWTAYVATQLGGGDV
jgi:hypothetical protein